MSDFDAVVIGAGHNGLTAAAVMARGGMRVFCLEKNHFIGGMASTTELIRGYQFEVAGSIQFPLPNEIYDDLGSGACPIYEPERRSPSEAEEVRHLHLSEWVRMQNDALRGSRLRSVVIRDISTDLAGTLPGR